MGKPIMMPIFYILCKRSLFLNSNQDKTEFMIFGTTTKRKEIENDLIIEIDFKPKSITDK